MEKELILLNPSMFKSMKLRKLKKLQVLYSDADNVKKI